MSIAADLRDICSKPSEARYALYEALAARIVAANQSQQIVQLATHLLTVEHAEQYGRTYIVPDMLNHLIKLIADPEGKNEDPMDVDDMLPLMQQLVDLIRPKVDDLRDALMNALELLAQCHQANGDFKSAAYALSSFKFDDKQNCSAEHRVRWYVQTAEFFLAINESGMASQQIKRAHALMAELTRITSKSAQALVLRFKTCYARILDAERKFAEAALRYMELSQSSSESVKDADRLLSLEYAVSCAILAKAGPQRSRVLAMLYSDDRSKQLPNYPMLEKMLKERIISASETATFEQLLQDHQKADTGSGRTVMQNSVIEHNMLAASKIYRNIRFDQLAILLGIKADEAEALAGSMIEQQRLKASIDQVESLLEFQSGGDEVGAWDEGIGAVCLAVNKLLDEIQRAHPGKYEV